MSKIIGFSRIDDGADTEQIVSISHGAVRVTLEWDGDSHLFDVEVRVTDEDGETEYLDFSWPLHKARALADALTRKWGRWQHQVDYRPFKKNKLILKPGVEIPQGVNNYGMVLTETSG